MKVPTTVLTALCLLLSSTPVLAHGGETHIMGTVATLDAATVVVKDRDGKSVSIHVTKDTKYEKGGVTAAAADLKVGERVMVEATGKEGDFTAAEIHFGSIPHDGDHHEHQ